MKSFAHKCPVDEFHAVGADAGTLHGALSDGIDKDFDTSVYREIASSEHLQWYYYLEWTPKVNIYKIVLKWTTYGDNSGGAPANNSQLRGILLRLNGGPGSTFVAGSIIERHSLTARTDTWTGTWEKADRIELGLQADTSNGGNGRGQIWELEVYGEFPLRLYSGSNTIYVAKNTGGIIRYGISGSIEELAIGDVDDDLETSVRFYDGTSVRVLAGLEE